jgi:hypothetical protein
MTTKVIRKPKTLKWPWTNYKKKVIRIFGFGSLISKPSLQCSVPRANSIPAYIEGYRRIFNYSYGLRSTSVLNVEPYDGIINGVLFEMSHWYMGGFAYREMLYDLVPVKVMSWENDENLGDAYMCRCITPRALSHKQPDWWYFHRIKEACLKVDEEFYNLFMDTTFTAGYTPISEWEEVFIAKCKEEKKKGKGWGAWDAKNILAWHESFKGKLES